MYLRSNGLTDNTTFHITCEFFGGHTLCQSGHLQFKHIFNFHSTSLTRLCSIAFSAHKKQRLHNFTLSHNIRNRLFEETTKTNRTMRSPTDKQNMVKNTPTRRTQLRKKRARFNNVVTVTEIPSRRVYTPDERFAVWYSASDYRCFRLEENMRKLKTNQTVELSDRVRENRFRKVHKRKHESKYTIGDKHKSAMVSTSAHDALSKAIEARIETNRRLAQIQWQMQQYQPFPNVAPTWIFNNPTPSVSKSTMFSKQGIVLPHMPSNSVSIRSSSTPMNSPVARGA